MATRTELALAWVALALCASAPAYAHKGEIKRRLLLEAAAGEVLEVLLEVKVTGKDRTQTLLMLTDSDRNGRIEGKEEGRLSALLVERGLDGVRVLVGSSTISLDGIETKLRVEPDGGPIELLLHGRAPLPAGVRRVSVSTGTLGDPLELALLPGVRRLQPRRKAKAEPGGVLSVGLGLGDKLVLDLAPASHLR